jgi:hypothetical protein
MNIEKYQSYGLITATLEELKNEYVPCAESLNAECIIVGKTIPRRRGEDERYIIKTKARNDLVIEFTLPIHMVKNVTDMAEKEKKFDKIIDILFLARNAITGEIVIKAEDILLRLYEILDGNE